MMELAIKEAQNSGLDIPVGAIITQNGKIISHACNNKEKTTDITGHAEILAIRNAEKTLNNWRLDNCEMYVTLEPCPMCAWAIIQSRIKTVYFGSYDTNYGALGSKTDLRELTKTNLKVFGGIMEEKCNNLLKDYFEKMRKQY